MNPIKHHFCYWTLRSNKERIQINAKSTVFINFIWQITLQIYCENLIYSPAWLHVLCLGGSSALMIYAHRLRACLLLYSRLACCRGQPGRWIRPSIRAAGAEGAEARRGDNNAVLGGTLVYSSWSALQGKSSVEHPPRPIAGETCRTGKAHWSTQKVRRHGQTHDIISYHGQAEGLWTTPDEDAEMWC